MRLIVQNYWPVLAIAVVGTAAAFAFGGGNYQYGLALVLIWAVVGTSWNIISGYGGQLAFGHAVFFGIGAYVSTLLMVKFQLSPIIGVVPAMLVAAIASLIIGWPTFRLSGVYFSLATLAYPLMFIPVLSYLGYQEVSVPYMRENGALYLQFEETRSLVLVALGLLVLCAIIVVAIERSRFGASLLAIRDDQWAAEAAGISAHRVKLKAFAISAALAAAAGVLYASLLLIITPHSVFGLTVTVKALMVSLVGGLATLWGPIIGAVILIPLSQYVLVHYGSVLPGIDNVVLGVFLVVVTILAPEGLYWRARDMLKRGRPATEPRDAVPLATAATGAASAAPARAPNQSISARPLLEVTALRKSFNGVAAVDDITLQVRDNEILGIIGPNGAGKTTLMNLLNGFYRPDGGRVTLAGKDITAAPPWRVADYGIARTFQVPRTLPRRTVSENIEIGAYRIAATMGDAKKRTTAILARVGLAHRTGAAVSDLSTAEIRKLELARALVGQPRILLLDEPLAGLVAGDITEFSSLIRSLRDEGLTIIIIEHTMAAMVALVDRFVVLDHGKLLAEGAPETVVKDPAVIEAYLGRGWANA